MTINNPTILNHNTPTLLGSEDSVNMKTVQATTLYTVPVGKTMVPYWIIIRSNTASLAVCQVTFGLSTALTDFLAAHTLTNITTAGSCVRLMPVPSATPAAESNEYTAGQIFQMNLTVAATAAGTATIELYGTLDDA
jgi:hypothetical protein